MELLIVIVLVTTLVTTAIPILAPGGDARKIREASRAVNSFFAGAQARAIETGRPYGVAIKRLSADTGNPDDNGVGVELSYVQVPPVYAGLSTSSRCRMMELNNIGLAPLQFHLQFVDRGPNEADRLPTGWDLDPVPGQFLRPGDTIWIAESLPLLIENGDGIRTARVETVGNADIFKATGESGFFAAVGLDSGPQSELNRFYVIPVADFARTAPGNFGMRLLPAGERFSVDLSPRYDSTGAELPPPDEIVSGEAQGPNPSPYWTAPAPYKIFRQPVPAQGQPLQLPAGTAIDLAASGFPGLALHRPSDAGTNPSTGQVFTDDIVVMFSPEGSISSARFRTSPTSGSAQTNVTSSLSLLVGRRELIPAEPDPEDTNATSDDPINVNRTEYRSDFESDETREKFAQYNWLNLDSRWVVLGAQTGSVTTVENAAINPGDLPDSGAFGLQQQMTTVRANAPRRLTAGGR